MIERKSRRRLRRPLLAAAVLVGGSIVALLVSLPDETAPSAAAPSAAPAQLPKRPLSRLEQAASARFARAQAKFRVGSKVTDVTDEEQALIVKVNVFKGLLVRDEEKRDPTFRLRAEAALAERRPARASITWDDPTGNRDLVFTIEDSPGCGLEGDARQLTLDLEQVAQYPCLDRENMWDPGTKLTVEIEPVARGEELWEQLLNETMKQMAADAYLARVLPAAGE